MAKSKTRLWSLGALAAIGLAAAVPSISPRPLSAAEIGSVRPLVIGHAGSAFLTPLNPFNPLPPNSWASLEQALRRGADGVEVDVQLSQDSVVMLYHDGRLESMTTDRGCISQQPAAALQQLPYRGGWPYDWFQQEQLITLDDFLARTQRQRPHLHLDLHHYDDCNPQDPYQRAPVLARALGRVLRRYSWPPGRLLILTTHQPTLAFLRRELPGVPLGLEITDNFADGLRTAQAERVQAIVVSKDQMTLAHTRQARAAGLQVVAFGGRSGGAIRRLLQCQPDAIQTDNVRVMQRLLGPKPRPTEAVANARTK